MADYHSPIHTHLPILIIVSIVIAAIFAITHRRTRHVAPAVTTPWVEDDRDIEKGNRHEDKPIVVGDDGAASVVTPPETSTSTRQTYGAISTRTTPSYEDLNADVSSDSYAAVGSESLNLEISQLRDEISRLRNKIVVSHNMKIMSSTLKSQPKKTPKAEISRSSPSHPRKSQTLWARKEHEVGEPRAWRDVSGTFTTNASLLAVEDTQGKTFVHLHKVNGVKIKVPLEKLCELDREFIQQFQDREVIQMG